MINLRFKPNVLTNDEPIKITKPKRKDTVMIEHDGKSMSIKDWAEFYSLDYRIFYNLTKRKNYTMKDILNIMGVFEK